MDSSSNNKVDNEGINDLTDNDTIQFHAIKNRPNFPAIKFVNPDFKQTVIHLSSTQEITWRAQESHAFPIFYDYASDSPSFVFQNATWCLRLYPNGTYLGVKSAGLTIVRLRSLVPRHKLTYRLMTKDSENKVCYQAADFDEDHKETKIVKVFDSELGLRWSIDIICQVSCYQSPYVVDAFSQTKLSMQDAKDVVALGQSLKRLLLDGQDHDVVLKVKDKEFRAHQNILRARSPVLESMLSHDMIEKNSGVIDIPDCDPGAFEQFLIYLYSGEVEALDAGNMLSLYYIADKYDAGHLKKECRQFVKESLSTSNITDVIQTALDHSDADILRCSTDYFVKEVDEILLTAEWLWFMKRNTVQANELFIKSRQKK